MTLSLLERDLFDEIADDLEAIDVQFPRPVDMAREIEFRTIQTPALDILDDALIDAAEGRDPYLIFCMPPQEGKSYRVSRTFPLWLLKRNPELRIAIVSYSDVLARRWGRRIRNDIKSNPQLGLAVRRDTAAANEWQLVDHEGGVITCGIEGSLTGRPVDVLIIDDPIKGMKEADSETYRNNAKEFWQSTAGTRLSEDCIVVVVQTRWHEDDFAGWLRDESEDGDWRYINIPAQADHNPDRGEVDILGREPGEFMLSARGRTTKGWLRRMRNAGSRVWNALYQGRPAPAEGNIFKREWWVTEPVRHAMRLSDGTWRAIGCDTVIISVDATFKDTKNSDFVAMGVWGKRGATAYLLDLINARMDFPTTCSTLVALCAKWPQASAKIIEDKANGPAILSTLRKKVPGLIAFTPVDSKEGRAHAVAPFIESQNVQLPDPTHLPIVSEFIEQCAAFPNGSHDDMVDQMTQGLHRLFVAGSRLDDFMNQRGVPSGERERPEAPSAAAMRERYPGSLPPRPVAALV